MAKMSFSWLLKMGWRESRNQKRRLLLFISSIILGIAALVAINSFRENLDKSISKQSKSLLGADIVFKSNKPIPDDFYDMVDSLVFESSEEVNFASMIYFPSSGGSRLVRIKAVKGGFPFYGTVITDPENVYLGYSDDKNTLIDQAVMIQYDAQAEDSVQIGQIRFAIKGSIKKLPGESVVRSTIAPTVFIPLRYLEETGLIQYGSRANYRLYVKTPENFDVEAFVAAKDDFLDGLGVREDTVSERRESLGRVTNNLTAFFNLIGIFALILGSIGVSSSISVYIQQKISTVAVLRCIGGTSRQIFSIYLLQTIVFGLAGTLAGVLLGIAVQYTLPYVASEILPVSVNIVLAWSAIWQGFIGGFVVTVLFTLYPLVAIRNVSPLLTLRKDFEKNSTSSLRDPVRNIIILLIVSLFLLFVYIQFNNLNNSLIFSLSIGLVIFVFIGLSRLLVFLSRRFVTMDWGYILRQSVANLYRPKNQTTALLMSMGIGAFLICTLYLTQSALLNQVSFSDSGKRPNMVLFDIQDDQINSLKEKMKEADLPVLQEVPIVTMRLHSLNDTAADILREDTTGRYENWALNRELRTTYRDSLTDSEELVAGVFNRQDSDSIFVSISSGYQESLGLKLFDKVVYNIQGVLFTTYVGSIRKVNWQRIQPNFTVLFPTGILEDAPKFHVLVTRVNNPQQSAAFQREMVQLYPGISIIDLGLVIETMETVLDQIAFVIRFIAFFSIVTGVVVLIGSLNINRMQRIKEAVLLRTLGATKKTIQRIMIIEYTFLGSLASIIGIGLSFFITWIFMISVFEGAYRISSGGIIIIFAALTLVTLIIGLYGNRHLLENTPLEVLREEN
jgi:putative ABC transport system permease protein